MRLEDCKTCKFYEKCEAITDKYSFAINMRTYSKCATREPRDDKEANHEI